MIAYMFEGLVKSSWIESLDYISEDDSETGEPYVLLTTLRGTGYQIFDVPEKLFKRWIKAPSKGKFWHRNIARRYITLRV